MKRAAGNAAERLCAFLDKIPHYQDGRWYRYGDWGCRMRISRIWARWGD